MIHDLLACAGFTAILMYGKPTSFLRGAIETVAPTLTKCALCLGFWVGVVMGYYLKEPFFPFSCAAFCWAFDAAVNALREVYVKD